MSAGKDTDDSYQIAPGPESLPRKNLSEFTFHLNCKSDHTKVHDTYSYGHIDPYLNHIHHIYHTISNLSIFTKVRINVAVAVGVMYSAVPFYGQIWNSNEI